MIRKKRTMYQVVGLLWPKRDEKSGKVLKYTGRITCAAPVILGPETTLILDNDPNKSGGTMRLTVVRPGDRDEDEESQQPVQESMPEIEEPEDQETD